MESETSSGRVLQSVQRAFDLLERIATHPEGARLSELADGAGLNRSTAHNLLASLEGPFAAPGQDGMRGADLALKEKNGMAGGKKIEFVKVSSDATPDKAVNSTRKAVEQDKVQIMIGPLSGDEGIAVKNYAKTKPDITFINGSSGAQATTLQDPAANFYRFNTEGAQWMVGIDAGVVRAHQHAAGARHQPPADVPEEVLAPVELDTGGGVE
jgi:hypothetical protein